VGAILSWRIRRTDRADATIFHMQKLSLTALALLFVGCVLLGGAAAQQTPASPSKPATAAKPGTTAKPHTSTAAKPATPAPLTTQKDKLSYAIGMNIGESMKKDSLDVDPNVLLRGLKDGMAGGKTQMTDEQARAIMTDLRTQMTKKKETEMQQAGASNKQAGQQFLAANKSKDGVVTLPSGLQYKILKEGTGPKPTSTDTVSVNYRGTLLNGTEFDSSYKRNEPATFPVSRVIKGWTEALQLMPVGSKWQVYIPSDLAYGERGAGADIGPNSTLIFDIELLSIQAKNQ
jgi:FKBP-type peptidyl-prolyl cis-trans isomerase FklB